MISIGVLNNLAEDISISELVENVTYNCEIDYQAVCSSFDNIILLKSASIYSGLASFFIVFSYFLIARISGSNRNLISKLFPPLIPIVLCMISAQVLTQGVIITFGAYLGESFLIGRVHFILIGAIGLGAGIGALQIIGSIFSLSKKLVHTQQGHLLLSEEHPKIWDFVKNIANKIDSKPPNNIIVGLEPTFYATAADVVGCGDAKLKGETLYLSLPLMRLFNRSELTAVVGHELGHFSAKDTAFSTKFAPVYRGLGNSINALSSANEGALSLAKLPALLVLASMYESFEKNVASISREREFEADKVGVSVSSGKDLAYSLSKVILFSPLWNNVRIDNIKRLNAGKISENLSLIFKDKSAYNLSKQQLDEQKENILASSISHPTDTHPILIERLKNVGFNSEEISIENILKQGDSCSDLVDNIEQIEKDLTLLEHRMMVESGYAVVPEDSGETDTLANTLYIMAAGMVGVDGKLEQEEIAVAEQIGAQLIDTFDPTDFREYVNNLDVIPNILEVAKELSSLDEDAKKLIYSYLEDIANADGDLAVEELNLLNQLKRIWSLN
tara:strand:- start:140 stop:1822 length:1683 start_codon:yes stop_codon:yes gene_type:complete